MLVTKDTFLSLRCTVVSLGFFLLVSLYLRGGPGDELQERLLTVVRGLMEVEDRHVALSPRVAVGYGACVDLLVQGSSFLPYDPIADSPRHFEHINTYEELYRSFAYYFKHGAATERYVSNATLFDSLVALAEKVPGSHYSLGGNAAVMALRLYREGCQVLLGSTLTNKQRNSLPSDMNIVGPPIQRDDIHLIVEYKTGERWGPYVTPRSNRYIIHNDVHNPYLSSFDAFNKELENFRPDLFVIGGLQLMDNYPFEGGVRESNLLKVKEQMKSVSKNTKVHFEMASFTEPELLHQLYENIIPFSDSLGMNEQELANLYSLYVYGNVSFVTLSTPRVATVLDQMRVVFDYIQKAGNKIEGSRKLTRMHVHTLAYQAVLTDISAKWKKSEVAAAKASLTAYRHVCASSEIDPESAALLLDDSFSTSVVSSSNRIVLVPENPVSCWSEGMLELCIAPGLVCTNATQTAGGGDNISAAALAMQL